MVIICQQKSWNFRHTNTILQRTSGYLHSKWHDNTRLIKHFQSHIFPLALRNCIQFSRRGVKVQYIVWLWSSTDWHKLKHLTCNQPRAGVWPCYKNTLFSLKGQVVRHIHTWQYLADTSLLTQRMKLISKCCSCHTLKSLLSNIVTLTMGAWDVCV